MNCSFCGYGLAPDDTVCGQCGQAVTFEAVLPVHPADVPVLLTPTNAFPPVRLRPHNSRLAWTALLLGILSPVTLGLTALPAIICAVIALWRIRRLGWLLRGRELAFNGLVIGALGLLVPLVVVPRVQAARDRTHEEEILRGLQHLRVALSQFQAHTGVYPDALADLVLPAGGHPSGTFPRTYQGPYLPAGEGIAGSGIPINPYVGPGDHNIGHHWRYNSDTGAVLPAVAPAKFIEALERNPGDPEL